MSLGLLGAGLLATAAGCTGEAERPATQTTSTEVVPKVVYDGPHGECRERQGGVLCVFTDEQGEALERCQLSKAAAKRAIEKRRC